MKAYFSLLVFSAFCIYISCGQSQQSASNTAIPNSQTEIKQNILPKSTQSGTYLKLTKHEIMDREGTGMVAFTCLVPEGWTVQDKLYWEYNDATLPIRYQGKFRDAKQNMLIQSYPDVRAVYSQGPTGTSGYPPPTGIIPGLKGMIKKERPGISFQVIDEKIINNPTPQKGYQQGAYHEQHYQSGFVRIEYLEGNQTMEEEFYGQLNVYNATSQGVVTMNSTIWAAAGLQSCKAPKGKLEECRKIALTIRASSKPTLPFYNKFLQVVQILSDQVYQRIYQAGQISKIISQTNDQISKTISDSYWQTQKSNDKSNAQFSDYLRGVDRYNDGNQTPVQLPSGYSNAWVNDRGEYLLSQSNGFDPNTTLTGNWKQLDKN
ncbi:MAG: hypothetical protein M3Q56_03345 [Bacteroidota bacterium]|nr:hypothetical protein [Bacteroidota bacterium]